MVLFKLKYFKNRNNTIIQIKIKVSFDSNSR